MASVAFRLNLFWLLKLASFTDIARCRVLVLMSLNAEMVETALDPVQVIALQSRTHGHLMADNCPSIKVVESTGTII